MHFARGYSGSLVHRFGWGRGIALHSWSGDSDLDRLQKDDPHHQNWTANALGRKVLEVDAPLQRTRTRRSNATDEATLSLTRSSPTPSRITLTAVRMNISAIATPTTRSGQVAPVR